METQKRLQNGNNVDGDGSALIFLGTGCSSAVPNAMCLLRPSDPPCHVCSQSLQIATLISDFCSTNGMHNYILIDVGKTFKEQVLRWFTFHKIPRIDSHCHKISLVQKKLRDGQEVRRVAQLDWKIIEESCDKSFVASGLEFVPLPMMHGEDYICLGFLFGENFKLAYISDVSRFPSNTEYVISKNGGGQLDFLILDCLYKKGSHNVHLCLPQVYSKFSNNSSSN
ncbi:putative hydrolase C777.06c [Hibiscus syriacus]|uniref:putative hydrolase C777.06c n=1 Tax=Hibiscus syriacus TaxID=106335 RepID=UPI001921BA65|nr:putative hydrolase C777.06c [Hibiscus syriacus]